MGVEKLSELGGALDCAGSLCSCRGNGVGVR